MIDGQDTSITVTIAGTGSGRVTHNLGSAECTSGTCVWGFTPGLTPTLSAVPDSGAGFTGWGGDCAPAGTGPCTLTVDQPLEVIATFDLP